MTKRIFSAGVVLFLLFSVLDVFQPCGAVAGHVEVRTGLDTVRSFVSVAFPVVVKRTLKLLGIFEVPWEVHLSNPENIRITASDEPDVLFLHVDADVELRGGGIFISRSGDRISLIMELKVSSEREGMAARFKKAEVPISDDTKVDLVPFLKPVVIPLDRVFHVKVQDRNIRGVFRLFHLEMKGDELWLKGNLTFEKSDNS